jgi:hypothetical protein
LTRIFTSLSIARFTGTRIFMMDLTGYSIGIVPYRAPPRLGNFAILEIRQCCGAGNLTAMAVAVNEHNRRKRPPAAA